jgi:drug/metabolite transporter (DMT)-like permease
VPKPKNFQRILILFVGIVSVSLAAIFIRLSLEEVGTKTLGFSLFLAASRLLIATSFLLPNWTNLVRLNASRQSYLYSILAGLALALHFASWITSLSLTSVAASTVLVTTNPLWVALFAWLWRGEKLTRLTFLGMLISLLGGIVIALGDNPSQPNFQANLLGNLLALLGAIMASLYFLWGREAQRQGLNTQNYITIAYSVAALFLLPTPLLFGSSYLGHSQNIYLYVLGMAIFSQLIGHTSLNWCLRWLSPTLVTVAILFEPIAASFLAWLLFAEIPSRAIFWGGFLLLLGVALAVRGSTSLAHGN